MNERMINYVACDAWYLREGGNDIAWERNNSTSEPRRVKGLAEMMGAQIFRRLHFPRD